MESTARVGDVKVLAERNVVHEDEADTMGVHPLLPVNERNVVHEDEANTMGVHPLLPVNGNPKNFVIHLMRAEMAILEDTK